MHYLLTANQRQKQCDCKRISVQFQVKTTLGISGIYKRMDDYLNDHSYYESQDQKSSHGIWFCDKYDQWIIGLMVEKGSCQGYAYTNSTSDCFPCHNGFGWRLSDHVSKTWLSLSSSAIHISCSYEGEISFIFNSPNTARLGPLGEAPLRHLTIQ